MGKSTSAPSSWKQKAALVLRVIFCTSNSTLDSSLFLCSCPNTVKMVTFGVKEPCFLIGSFPFLADCFYSLILTLPHSLGFFFFFPFQNMYQTYMLDLFLQFCIFLKLSYFLSLHVSVLPPSNFLQSGLQFTNFLLSFVDSTL